MGVHQERQTYEDTKYHQRELFKLIRRKIYTGRGLSLNEKENFPDLVSDALMSQAWIHMFYESPDNKRIDLGSTKYFALNMLDVKGQYLIVTDKRTETKYRVSMRKMWKIFYEKCKELSQPALEEAIKMSKESHKRERPTAKAFSSDEKIT